MQLKIRQLMNNSSFIIVSGILPSNFGIITIVLCYHLSVNVYNHFPSWLWMPVISLLGCMQPERTIYQIGFTITSLSTLLFYFTFKNGLLKVLPYNGYHKTIKSLKYTILLCAIGVFGQGIITLSDDVVDILIKDDGIDNYIPSWQSIVHQLCALLFFISGLFHGIICIILYHKLKDTEDMKQLKFSRWFKSLLLVITLTQIVASILYHPANFNNKGKTKNMLNVAGVAQWTVVFTYLVFFSSYSLDYYLILKKRREKNTIDVNDDTLLMDEVEMFLGKPNFQAVL